MKYKPKQKNIVAFRLGIDEFPDWFLEPSNHNKIRLGKKMDDQLDLLEIVNRNHYVRVRKYKYFSEFLFEDGTEMKAEHGDYIIMDLSGDIYPCKPSIFKKIYKKLGEEE